MLSVDYSHESVDVYAYYKSAYDRELRRKETLDNDYIRTLLIPFPLLIAISYHFFSQIDISILGCTLKVLLIVLGSVFIFSSLLFLIFLSFAYNNGFKGFNYYNIPLLSKTRASERNHSSNDIKFSILEMIVSTAESFQEINNTRADYYFKSRMWLILMAISTFLLLIFFVFI